MTSEIFVNAGPGETRIAWRQDGRLCELEIDRPAITQNILGNIYVGRVEKVVGGLEAAFVDIGRDRAGFLALPEVRPAGAAPDRGNDRIGAYLNEGDAVLVQVAREEIEDKGAKLTTRITVPGIFLVLTPDDPRVHVSRHIESEGEKERLNGIIDENKLDIEGFIVRTAATDAAAGDILRDMILLREQWAEITGRNRNKTSPVCLHQEPPTVCRCIRNIVGRDVSRMVIDEPRIFNLVKKYCERTAPFLLDRIESYRETTPIFEAYGIEDEIETALAPRINLPSGGRLQIEHTAALTAIDIDTARASDGGGREEANSKVNLEAAVEIARQVRLRNIGGYVVVDFVPMKRRENREKVLSVLRREFARDPCPAFVGGFTKLGKLELTRRRQRDSMANMVLEGGAAADRYQCPKTAETVAFEALRAAVREARANPGKRLEVLASPVLVDMLQNGGAKPGLEQAQEMLGGPLKITVRSDFAALRYEIVSGKGSSGL
jgi:ribonuclease G